VTRTKPQRRTAAKTPTRDVETPMTVDTDAPRDEAARDSIDAGDRHRLISEAAHALYAERGYVDGFHFEDWLTAEARIDTALINRGGAKQKKRR